MSEGSDGGEGVLLHDGERAPPAPIVPTTQTEALTKRGDSGRWREGGRIRVGMWGPGPRLPVERPFALCDKTAKNKRRAVQIRRAQSESRRQEQRDGLSSGISMMGIKRKIIIMEGQISLEREGFGVRGKLFHHHRTKTTVSSRAVHLSYT